MNAFANITAFVLAGGLGTRLRSVVADRPKVLAEVAGRPFLHFLLNQLAAAGVRDVVLGTGYMADLVESTLGFTHGPLSLRYSPETTPLGTGGAVRAALPMLTSSTVLMLNGDSYCDAELGEFHAQHLQSGAKASILLAHVADSSRFGSVKTDAAGTVTEFTEKRADAGPGWINAGIYLIDRSLIEAIPTNQAVSIERDVFPRWIGHGLRGVSIGRALLDIGTPESLASSEAFLRGKGLC